jgi:UPF0716 protein FxsA
MRFVVLGIVLAFPVLDFFATLRLAQLTGTPAIAWFAFSVAAGLYLLRNERLAFRARTVAALHGGQPLLRGLLDSGRKVLAGMLFILPGIVSDLAALALLMLPINVGGHFGPQPAAAGRSYGRTSIDGEYRRLD